MQTLYTRDNLKPSLWIISVYQTENSISQRLHGYCFYLQLQSSVEHKFIISLDSKVCSQRCKKWIISSKSLLMLSVNNDHFNYYSILSDCCCCCQVTSVVSNSVRPDRQQPTRLCHPWDSPGKNTGVGCHFLLQCMKVKSESEVAQSCPTLSDPVDYSLPDSSVHGIFQSKSTGVGCHCLLQN